MTLRDPRGLGRWLAVPRAGRRRGAGRDGADVGIELHPWGASEADPLHPDWIVLDLDPGEGVPFTEVVQAAHDVHDQLKALGFAAFPRTTGGKGLHIVVPIAPRADWEQTKALCRAFAEAMSPEEPHRCLPTLSKAERRGRILIDYLRNGLGATATGSFCPRARPGATVAMPLAWAEVKPGLAPVAFTVRTVPDLLRKWKRDPWAGFRDAAKPIPELALKPPRATAAKRSTSTSTAARRGHGSGTRCCFMRASRWATGWTWSSLCFAGSARRRRKGGVVVRCWSRRKCGWTKQRFVAWPTAAPCARH